MKLSVPKGETYIRGRGEVEVKANEFFDLTKIMLLFYIYIIVESKWILHGY
jgi:hypothetical protein